MFPADPTLSATAPSPIAVVFTSSDMEALQLTGIVSLSAVLLMSVLYAEIVMLTTSKAV